MKASQGASIPLDQKRLLDIEELMAYIGLGRNRAMAFGEKIGAKRPIGGRVLYDRIKIDKHFDSLNEEYEAEKE